MEFERAIWVEETEKTPWHLDGDDGGRISSTRLTSTLIGPVTINPASYWIIPLSFFRFYSDGCECRCASEAWRRADKGDRAGHAAAWWTYGRLRRRRSAMVRTENHFIGNCGVIRNQQWLLLLTWWDLTATWKTQSRNSTVNAKLPKLEADLRCMFSSV